MTCSEEITGASVSTNDAVSVYLHSNSDLTSNTNCNMLSKDVDSNDELEIRAVENLVISLV